MSNNTIARSAAVVHVAEGVDEERQGLLSGEASSPRQGFDEHHTQDKKRISWIGGGLVALLLFAFFGVPLFRASSKRSQKPGYEGELQSNGTHFFKRTVLMVSIDGLRAEYLERGLTPHLLEISKKGLRAKYLQPVFPTLTFPNHWSLMTGLYAESHGIVANNFWDPDMDKEFHYNRADITNDTAWWYGEPMWETAERVGVTTANLMWPGPPAMASGARSSYSIPWRNKVTMDDKLKQIMDWIDLPLEERPQLLLAYEPSLDQAGHKTGPNSALVNATLSEVDRFAHSLHHAIEARNLTSIVDIIIISDHGMTDTSHPTFLFMDDEALLGHEGWAAVTHEDGWPAMGLRFATVVDERKYLKRLLNAANGTYKDMIDVYTKETMPERYHFAHNKRIAPIYVVPRIGYALTNREENGVGMTKGNHGYDNADPSMHAMFVAHGPFSGLVKDAARRRAEKRLTLRSYASSPAQHITIHPPVGDCDMNEDGACVLDGFQNVEVYNLVMSLLGVERREWAPTNGTEGFWERYL